MTSKSRALLHIVLVLAIVSALPACGKHGNRNPIGPDPTPIPEPTPEPIPEPTPSTCPSGSFCGQTPEGVTIVFSVGNHPDPRMTNKIIESLEVRFPLINSNGCVVPGLTVTSKGKVIENGTFLVEGSTSLPTGNSWTYSVSGTITGDFASGTAKRVWNSAGGAPYCTSYTLDENWTAEKAL